MKRTEARIRNKSWDSCSWCKLIEMVAASLEVMDVSAYFNLRN